MTKRSCDWLWRRSVNTDPRADWSTPCELVGQSAFAHKDRVLLILPNGQIGLHTFGTWHSTQYSLKLARLLDKLIASIFMLFSVSGLKDEKLLKSKSKWKLKHANSILEYFDSFCQMLSKLMVIISSYSVSKLVHNLSRVWLSDIVILLTVSSVCLVCVCYSRLYSDAVRPRLGGRLHDGLQLPALCRPGLRHRAQQLRRQAGVRVKRSVRLVVSVDRVTGTRMYIFTSFDHRVTAHQTACWPVSRQTDRRLADG